MRPILLFLSRAQAVLVVLAIVIAVTPPSALRYGDRLQVALPLLAWACAGSRREGAEFFLRYAVMFTTAHAAKTGLGGAEINRRPDGGGKGFPSAHTSTAVLGASSLAHDCLRAAPVAQAAVIAAAAFVGASRIEGHKHDIWQVLAGALLGYGCDRALRHPSPARSRLRAALGRVMAALASDGQRRLARLRLRVTGRLSRWT
ncbi:MAG: phosphatase PAP2 family protein [Gemmobacter sp.]